MIKFIREMNQNSGNKGLIPVIMTDRAASMINDCVSERQRVSVVADNHLLTRDFALEALGLALGGLKVVGALKEPKRSDSLDILKRAIARCRAPMTAVAQ